MKIAFTGARGYIGQAFDRLNRHLDLIPLSYSLDGENYYSTSYMGNKDLNELLNSIKVLIHFGSFTPKNNDQVQDKISSEKNLNSTFELVKYKLPNLKHIIYASTIDVYDFSTIVSEKTKPNPKTEYGKSKLTCENIINQFAEDRGILCSILRIGTIYGPGANSYQKVIPVMLADFLSKQEITIYDEGIITRNFLYLDDLIKIIVEIIFNTINSKIINLTGIHPTSIRELASNIQNLAPEHTVRITDLISKKPSANHNFDTTLMNSCFPNFKFTPMNIGLMNEMSFIKSRLL